MNSGRRSDGRAGREGDPTSEQKFVNPRDGVPQLLLALESPETGGVDRAVDRAGRDHPERHAYVTGFALRWHGRYRVDVGATVAPRGVDVAGT